MKTERDRFLELSGLKPLKNSILEEVYGDFAGQAADYNGNFRPKFPEQAQLQMDANAIKPCLRETKIETKYGVKELVLQTDNNSSLRNLRDHIYENFLETVNPKKKETERRNLLKDDFRILLRKTMNFLRSKYGQTVFLTDEEIDEYLTIYANRLNNWMLSHKDSHANSIKSYFAESVEPGNNKEESMFTIHEIPQVKIPPNPEDEELYKM